MAHNAMLGRQEWQEEQVAAEGHPCVILSMLVKPGVGQLKLGQLVAQDAEGLLIPCPVDGDPVGVNAHLVDLSSEGAAAVIVHGTVNKSRLNLVDGPAPEELIAALAAKHIWAV